jgi:hypothetical protein
MGRDSLLALTATLEILFSWASGRLREEGKERPV